MASSTANWCSGTSMPKARRATGHDQGEGEEGTTTGLADREVGGTPRDLGGHLRPEVQAGRRRPDDTTHRRREQLVELHSSQGAFNRGRGAGIGRPLRVLIHVHDMTASPYSGTRCNTEAGRTPEQPSTSPGNLIGAAPLPSPAPCVNSWPLAVKHHLDGMTTGHLHGSADSSRNSSTSEAYPTWTTGLRVGSGSACRSTSRVRGGTSPSPVSR